MKTFRFSGFLLALIVALGTSAAAQRPVDPTAPLLLSPKPVSPSVVCGTTVFPASEALDPKIAKPTPKGDFKMRVVFPAMCGGTSRLPPLAGSGNRLPIFLGPKR